MTKNYGFIAPKITSEDYSLGALKQKGFKFEVLQPNGQWIDFLPEFEHQRRHGLETYNCTNFGTLNALEILHRRLYNLEENYSERYLGVLSNTSQQGNEPHAVAETIRKYGCIPEEFLPWSDHIDTWNEYYSPRPMTQNYVNIGEHWKDNYDFGHEWVWTWSSLSLTKKQELLMEHLKESPIGISVYAWTKNPQGLYYKPSGYRDNHWVVLVGYEHKKYWLVYDSYNEKVKKVDWNNNFSWAKKYYLKALNPETEALITQEITTEEVRKAWLLRPDLQKEFPASNKFISIHDPHYTIYHWAHQFGPKEMPEIFTHPKNITITFKSIWEWIKGLIKIN
jgi:hypothetical protein